MTKTKQHKKLDPFVCMVCGTRLGYGEKITGASFGGNDYSYLAEMLADANPFHCDDCKNAICEECAQSDAKCVVCGGETFAQSGNEPEIWKDR